MSVSLIKFTQGVTIGTAGQALIGTATGIAVVVTNDNNTGVASWEIDILDVPGSSAIPIGILASNDSSSTPSASFTPDVKGSYRVRLQTWGVANRIGTPDIDIRVFTLRLDNSWIAPPAQIFPRQLPPPGSGLTNSKPDEMNFGGQSRGWAGGGADGLLNAFIAAAGTGGGGGGVTFSAGTASNLLSSVVFSNSNGVSFGLSGSTITASGGGVTTAGFFGVGNTTQNSSTTLPLASLSFNGLGAMSVGYSNGSIQMSAPAVSSIVGVGGITIITTGNTVSISGGGTGGGAGSVNFSAGTTSGNLGSVVFSNSNGVSFGLSGGTITASAAGGTGGVTSGGFFAAGNTTQNSSTTLALSSLKFNGLGAMSVGYSNGSIQMSAPAASSIVGVSGVSISTNGSTVSIWNNVNLSAGTTSNNLTNFIFSNSNGVSFGLSGSTVTASVAGGGAGSINVSGGTTSNNLTNIVFSNSNNVSFGLNGSTVTGSASFSQTVQTQNVVVPSAGTQTAASGTVVFSNSNGISFGMSGSSRITASYTVPSTAGLISAVNFSAGTTSNNGTNFVFSNSNGVSFGLNGSTVTASYTVPSTAGLISGINLSAGTTSNNLTNFVFSNSNNVSFGLNGSTVTASISVPAQTNQTGGIYAVGNTTAQSSSSTFDARSLSIQGAQGVSVGWSNGSLVISGATGGGGGITNINVSAGTTSNNLSAITFSNGSGVSFGLNGSVITGSVAAGATATGNLGGIAAGTQTATSGSVVFANSNGLTFGMSGSSQITGSYTVPSTAGLISAINFSAGTTSNNGSAIVFSNSNNVSFGLNGSTVTASITVPAQTNQSVGLYGLGNTTQNSSTTLDARSISFNGLGAVTVGYSNGSVQLSVPVQSAQTQNIVVPSAGTQTATSGTVVFSNSNGITFGMSGSSRITASHNGITGVNLSAGTTSNNLTNFVFSNSNGVTFGLNGSTVTASVAGGAGVTTAGFYALGNTTQNSSTTLALASLSYNGLGAMTVGYSNGSIQLSAPPTTSVVGVGGIILSSNGSTVSISNYNITNFEPAPFVNTGSYLPGVGSWYFEPFELPANLSGGRVNRLMSFDAGASVLPATSVGSFNSATTGSRSVSYSYANSLALYTMGTGTNSSRIESLWSNTFSVGIAQSVRVSSGGGGLTVTNAGTISYIASINSAGAYTTTTYAGSTSITTTATTMNRTAVTVGISSIINMLAGNLMMPVGFNTTIPPGMYYLGQAYSTASTTAGTAASVWAQLGVMGISGNQSSPKIWGATTTAQSLIFPGAGGVYSAASASPPSTIAFSQINIGPANRQYFNIVNSTI